MEPNDEDSAAAATEPTPTPDAEIPKFFPKDVTSFATLVPTEPYRLTNNKTGAKAPDGHYYGLRANSADGMIHGVRLDGAGRIIAYTGAIRLKVPLPTEGIPGLPFEHRVDHKLAFLLGDLPEMLLPEPPANAPKEPEPLVR